MSDGSSSENQKPAPMCLGCGLRPAAQHDLCDACRKDMDAHIDDQAREREAVETALQIQIDEQLRKGNPL